MTLLISNKDHPAESTHWYTPEGLPAYETQAKDGSMRPTTLRDARVKKLIPSVTTIIKCAASPGLENWKLEQMLLAALTLPRIPSEPEKDFLKRVRADSKEQGKAAAERGTAVHTSVEGFYEGKGMGDHPKHVEGVKRALDGLYGPQDWLAEKSFGSKYGFGGKIDLCSPAAVLDIKTKEFDADNLPSGFEEHLMQLAAYRVGVGMPNAACANVFVSVTNPGLVHIHKWEEKDLVRGWGMFVGLLNYWYAKTGLDTVRIPV
jgi:hypothetical protein